MPGPYRSASSSSPRAHSGQMRWPHLFMVAGASPPPPRVCNPRHRRQWYAMDDASTRSTSSKGLADISRHIIQRILNPRLWSHMASCDVVSTALSARP